LHNQIGVLISLNTCAERKVSAMIKVVVVVAYFSLSRLLYLAYSANLGLLCMLPHPGMGPRLTSLPRDGGVSCFGRSSGGRPSNF